MLKRDPKLKGCFMKGLRRTLHSRKQLNAAVYCLVVATTSCKFAGCEACLGIYVSGWTVMIDCCSDFSGHCFTKRRVGNLDRVSITYLRRLLWGTDGQGCSLNNCHLGRWSISHLFCVYTSVCENTPKAFRHSGFKHLNVLLVLFNHSTICMALLKEHH